MILTSNQETEQVLRRILKKEGFRLLIPSRRNGETGVDVVAEKNGEKYFIEVIGRKKNPPAASKDFYTAFFGCISRLDQGVKHLVIAMPSHGFRRGMPSRKRQYGEAWDRIGRAFPELELWFVDATDSTIERIDWAKGNF